MGIARRTGGVLLKIIEEESASASEEGIDLKKLLISTQLFAKKGHPLYNYDIAPNGELTSDDFWYDIQALASASAIEIVGENPHIKITERGKIIAENLELSPELNDIIIKI